MTSTDEFTRVAVRDLKAFLTGSDPQRPPRTRWGRAFLPFCVVLTIAITLGNSAYLNGVTSIHDALLVPVALLISLPLLIIPARPLMAWRVAWLVAVFSGITWRVNERVPWPWGAVELFVLMFAMLAAAIRHRRGVRLYIWLSAALLLMLFVDGSALPGTLAGATAIIVLADQIGVRRDTQARLGVAEERSELEHARRAILEERTRIARELHDVVAHHMSLIAVRAETAPFRLDDVTDATAAEFAAIATGSREALTEMRRLLGVLRSEAPPPKEPQPDLADLQTLADQAREAGVQVTLTVAEQLTVPDSVGLTAYRIVQEALSNARRHAAGGAVHIILHVDGETLVVDVVNGRGTPMETPDQPDGKTAGQGLEGMRARAGALGGTLVAGPTSDGGFAVHAKLPTGGGK
jgi:signal transduction histidine kinase